MRKVLFPALMLLASTTVFAQKAMDGKWGAFAGANVSTSSADHFKWTLRGQAGVLYDYHLNGTWGLQPRLQFAYTECRGKGTQSNALYSQWALSMPVMASCRFDIGSSTSIQLNAGPYLQYAFFGQQRLASSPNKNRSFWHQDFGRKFTWGGQAGVQLNANRVFFDLSVRHSLRKSLPSANGRESTVMLSVGYRF